MNIPYIQGCGKQLDAYQHATNECKVRQCLHVLGHQFQANEMQLQIIVEQYHTLEQEVLRLRTLVEDQARVLPSSSKDVPK